MEALFLVSLSILFLLLCFFIYTHKTNGRLPPGPPVLPLIGNIHHLLDNSAPHRHLWHLCKLYGPLMSLRVGSVPILVVSSAKAAAQVLKTYDAVFASRPSLLGQKTLSYNGLDIGFAPYGDYWREMRKLCVQHLFNSRRIQSFRPIREDKVVSLIGKISKSAASGEEINLTETLICFTSGLIYRIAFNRKYEEEEEAGGGRTRFHSLINEAQALLTEFYFSDYFPMMGWVDRVRRLPRRLHKTFQELDEFYERVIEDHLNPNRPETEEEDILDILLRGMNDGSFPLKLTLDHIKAVLMVINAFSC